MPVTVIAHDERLEGRSPVGSASTIVIDVNEETPIADFFDRIVEIFNSNGLIDRLYIMAHGVLVTSEDTSAIMFCREFISYRTVDQFSRLRDKVDRIILFVCHAAESTMTRHGDGDELCRQIALNAHAEVTAAREEQAYSQTETCHVLFCEESAIEFGEWEGPVVVYGRDGNILAEFQNPSVVRGPNGELFDPRISSPH